MIISMPTTARPQQRYDHRLRRLVQRTGDVSVATDLGVPRSTARGWLGASPTLVVGLDVVDLSEPELRQEVVKLRRRVRKLTALLRLALALLRTSGFRLTGARLPDGRTKTRILRAVDRAREYLPLRAVLRFLRVSPSRFHAWRQRQRACALDDQSCCPRTSPSRLTPPEVRAIEDMVTSPDYRHVPTGTLAVRPAARHGLGLTLNLVPPRPSARLAPPAAPRPSGETQDRAAHDARERDVAHRHHRHPSTRWDPRVSPCRDRQFLAAHPGLARRRHLRAGQQRDRAGRRQSGRGALRHTPVVLADAGVENVNAHVDALIQSGVLRRLLAFTELKFSNSMIEAWWRSLKHQWLFLHPLDSITTVRRLVAFYVDEHNRVLPHSAFRGQTPDEMYFGTGDAVPADLRSRATAARLARVEANRSASCATCPSVGAAA
jgi:putative transposase